VTQVVDVERGGPVRRMRRIIDGKFSHREQGAPLPRLGRAEAAEDVFHNAVHPLGLAIGLRVIRCGAGKLTTK